MHFDIYLFFSPILMAFFLQNMFKLDLLLTIEMVLKLKYQKWIHIFHFPFEVQIMIKKIVQNQINNLFLNR
jgi:hypothetical protein